MKKLTLLALAVFLAASFVQATTWWQTFGGTRDDEGQCVQQTSDGGYIVSGFTWSFGRPGEFDTWLIKLDSLGHKKWDQTYEGSWWGGLCVRQSNDNGFIIAAGNQIIRTNEIGDTLWTRDFGGTSYCVQQTSIGNYVLAGVKSEALWLIKLDNYGDILWERSFPRGNYGSQARYVELTQEGNYMVTGGFTDTMIVDEDVYFRSALWLFMFSDEGDTLWTKAFESDEWGKSYYAFCGRQTFDGGYVFIGSWLMKTDEYGDSLWTRTFGGVCVEQTSDSGYIITSEGKAGTLLSAPVGGDLLLVKTDENGDTLWTRGYGGDETDDGKYVQQTSDKGYIVTGHTWSYGAGGRDLYLIKTDSLGLLSVKEEPVTDSRNNWQVVAPIASEIVLRYSNHPQGFRANVYDALGRKVEKIRAAGSTGTISWGTNHVPGVYFIKEENANQANTVKVVLVR